MEPSLFEKTELGDFQAINDPKTTLSELEKSAQERIYLKLVEEIERITNHGKTKSARIQKRNVFSTDKNEM